MPPKISAVVRTYNSESTLRKTLRALRIQAESISEVVVVDSGSSDRTLEIARHFGCRILAYPTDRPFNYSDALNLGIEATTSGLLLIISSHTVIPFTDIVRTMRENLERFDACGVYCDPAKPPFQNIGRSNSQRGHHVTIVSAENFTGYNGLANTCSLIRRSCWVEHQFDPTMVAAEDQEWALWHYRHTGRPTVGIRNAGVLYLNRRFDDRKYVRDHVVISTRLVPALRSWRAIAGILLESAAALRDGRRGLARRNLKLAWELARSHVRTRHYESRYF